MNFNITYLDHIPDTKIHKERNDLRSIIEEFMRSDKPAMRIEVGDHYTSMDSAYTSWNCAIKRTKYAIVVRTERNPNAVLLIKGWMI